MQGRDGFLKGLIVVDDVAYFGMSPPMERQGRDAVTVSCALVAVDLVRRRHLFTHQVATRGLLNLISAPQLSPASTYIAQYTGARAAGQHVRPRAPGADSAGHDALERPALQGASGAGEVGEEAEERAFAHWSESWLKSALAEHDIAGALLLFALIHTLYDHLWQQRWAPAFVFSAINHTCEQSERLLSSACSTTIHRQACASTPSHLAAVLECRALEHGHAVHGPRPQGPRR